MKRPLGSAGMPHDAPLTKMYEVYDDFAWQTDAGGRGLSARLVAESGKRNPPPPVQVWVFCLPHRQP